jgi:hypothetical protein
VTLPFPVVQPEPIDDVPTVIDPSSPLLTVLPQGVPPVELLVSLAPVVLPVIYAPEQDPVIYPPKQDRN